MSSNSGLTTASQHAIRIAGDEFFTQEQWQLLTDTIMKGATPQEAHFFGEVCKRVGLDPFKRQIHAVKRWDNEAKRFVWTYQTGIDGYRSIANSCGTYAGSDEPLFLPADESTPNPRKATVTVWKIVAGHRVPFTASARWEEYVQTTKEGKPNSMWRKMPYGQLAKCAEALALRKAFPDRLSGVYTDVEMEQADSEGDPPHAQPKGRSFNIETTTFEQPKPQQLPEPAPEPKPAPQSKAQPKPKESPKAIDAEVLPPFSPPIPNEIAIHTGGKWRETLGDIKGKELTEARKEGPPAALASVIDEIRAKLKHKGITEDDFAAEASQKIQGMGFPEDLWMEPDLYASLLTLCREMTA